MNRSAVARSPEALFVAGAITQYGGAAIAISLFDTVAAESVAWLRILGAAVVLLGWSIASHRGDLRSLVRGRSLALIAGFGVITAVMNMAFYLAIDRVDLGKAVAVEFVGPVAVAAALTRSRRDAIALLAAVAGVVLLSQIETDVVGLLFVLAASAAWAGYIVAGSRVARENRGLDGLALALGAGAVLTAPVGALHSGPAWSAPGVLLACLAIGVLSTVVPYGIDQHVLRRIPTRRFALLLALLPASATVVGLALGQVPRPLELLGIALILAAVAGQERSSL